MTIERFILIMLCIVVAVLTYTVCCLVKDQKEVWHMFREVVKNESIQVDLNKSFNKSLTVYGNVICKMLGINPDELEDTVDGNE